MTLRSRLFAGVALPLLSVAMTVQPVFAANDQQPFELAQSSDEQQPQILPEEQPQAQTDEQPAEQPVEKKHKKRHAEEQAPAEEQAAPQPEPEAQAPAEQPAAEPQPEAAPAEEPQQEQPTHKRHKQQAEEQPAGEQEQAPQRKHKKQAAEETAPAEQAAPQPETEAQAPAEQPAAEPQPDAAPAAEPQQEQPTRKQQAEEQPAAGEQEQAPQRKHKKQAAEETAPAEQAAPQPETEAQAPAEQPAAPQPESQQSAEQPQTEGAPAQPAEQTQGESGGAAPATDAAAGQPPAPPIVDKRTVEEKKAIAADPSKTDETVVLPVTNGAAVLDSDKDADNRGGQSAREERRRQREAQRSEQAAPPPKTDAEAQAAAPQVKVEDVRKQIEEKGQRVDKAPQFALPTVVEGGGAMQSGTADGQSAGGGSNRQKGEGGNTTINTTNNVVILQQNDNRTVLRVDNHMVVRGDDRPRLSRDAEETHYDRLPRGRYRETIERPNGVRLITIYNRYGDIIQRSRIGRDGEEYLLVYAPDADRDRPPVVYDAGRDLPPMRLRIPVEDYIIDTSSEPDRDYYDFLAEPPVERVERTYSIDEVKYSARLRDKVRRIDLDTITFATGSAEVPMSQARTLRQVADAIQKLLKRDPGETFLIEGHTDAVGSDQSNLILSDKRADSVASLLTEVYGIPPENMTTQGYGERYLKVRTQSAEQQNRRVTIRRVTPLVRPVAKN